MTARQLLNELTAVAQALNIVVRFEAGHFRGGSCTLNQQRMIIINRSLPIESKISILARSLLAFPLEHLYLKPALREYLEQEAAAIQMERTTIPPNGFQFLAFDPPSTSDHHIVDSHNEQ